MAGELTKRLCILEDSNALLIDLAEVRRLAERLRGLIGSAPPAEADQSTAPCDNVAANINVARMAIRTIRDVLGAMNDEVSPEEEGPTSQPQC